MGRLMFQKNNWGGLTNILWLAEKKGVLVISGAKIAVTTVKINLLRWFKSFEEV